MERGHPFGHPDRCYLVLLGLLAPESITLARFARRRMDTAQAAPARAGSRDMAAHLCLGVMDSAAVAKQGVGHRDLRPVMNVRENELVTLQDDEEGGFVWWECFRERP
ncbi:MAG: hypothetical protein WCA83_11295 [Azonexus sp.]